MEHVLAEKIKGTLKLELFSMQDDKNWYHPADDYRYEGFILQALVNMRF